MSSSKKGPGGGKATGPGEVVPDDGTAGRPEGAPGATAPDGDGQVTASAEMTETSAAASAETPGATSAEPSAETSEEAAAVATLIADDAEAPAGADAGDPEFPSEADISRNGDKDAAGPGPERDADTAESPATEDSPAGDEPLTGTSGDAAADTGSDTETESSLETTAKNTSGSTSGGTSESTPGAEVSKHEAAPGEAAPPPPPGGPGGRPGGGGGGGGKRPKRGKKVRSRKARYARRILFTLLGFIGFFIAAFAVAYLFTPVPSAQEQAIAQGPTFYYSDGKTQIAKTGMNRDAVKLDQIPPGVRNAVIAAENRSFYQDPGVSVQGTLRAFWSTATGEQLQGGSTITQQMVRNYYGGIGKERSVTRKLKEVMVSLKVGREKSKGWILEQYLNTIYFGRDAYGVQAAAKAYYGKDVKELTPAEGAYLAAAIQQPSNFSDPTGARRGYAEQRWRAVVANMVRDGAVTQADAAAMRFPAPVKERITDVLKGQKGYMVNVAKKELIERRGYSEDEINRSGLKITTTFDKRLMDAVKQAVVNNAPPGMSKKIRTAVVSVDPATGQVLAFYGGRDYLDEALSSAFGDWAQVGSGFKPIALAAALDDGKTLSETYDGSSPQYFRGAPIRNDSNENFGQVNLVNATEHSINTAYVNLGQDIGTKRIARMAEKMGVPAGQMLPEQREAPTFPLGVVSMHPVQQAGVYSTFAAEGVHRAPFVVKSVKDNDDHTRKFTEKGERAFSAQVARDATYAMQQVVQGGTGRGAQLADGRDVAGKTGTTNGGRAIWFNGFIPQMATTVSMFRSDQKPLDIPGYGAYGGQLPAQIWNSYMSEAVNIKGYDQQEFGSPSETPGSGFDSPTPGDQPGGSEPPRTSVPTRRTPSDGPGSPEIPRPPTGIPTHIPTGPGGGGNDGGGENDGGGGDDGGGGNDGGGGGGTGPNRPGGDG